MTLVPAPRHRFDVPPALLSVPNPHPGVVALLPTTTLAAVMLLLVLASLSVACGLVPNPTKSWPLPALPVVYAKFAKPVMSTVAFIVAKLLFPLPTPTTKLEFVVETLNVPAPVILVTVLIAVEDVGFVPNTATPFVAEPETFRV